MSIDDISRRWIAFGKKELNELFAQVQDLAINIKVFSVIADASKNKRIKHQYFFGWLQRSCIFPLAVIDGLKLCNQYYERTMECTYSARHRRKKIIYF